ncbi:MAG: hypothetical protein HPY60_11490 [Candidatus Methanofastidiosum sp.]|nr:hypothetical protein [Methanofastidiosum sp.]
MPKSNLQTEQSKQEQKENKTSIEELKASLEEIQKLNELEVKSYQEKEQSILQIITTFAKAKMEQIVLNENEYTKNFIEYWKIIRDLEITKAKDIGQIYTTGYNALLETFKQYIVEQRKLWVSLMKDAYAAGKAITNAFAAGRNEMDYEGIAWNIAKYNQINYNPVFTSMPEINQNAITIVLNPTQSDSLMSAISPYISTAIRGNS